MQSMTLEGHAGGTTMFGNSVKNRDACPNVRYMSDLTVAIAECQACKHGHGC